MAAGTACPTKNDKYPVVKLFLPGYRISDSLDNDINSFMT